MGVVSTPYLSGWCGSRRHDHCLGVYASIECSCPCGHARPPEPPPPLRPPAPPSALVVDMGGLTYRSVPLSAPERHRLSVAVHTALQGLGFEPWVTAHGMVRDEWGALRPGGAS